MRLFTAAQRNTSEGSSMESCTICLDALATERCTQLACGHVYHDGCLLQWVTRNISCPVCRQGTPTRAARAPHRDTRDPRTHATWTQVAFLLVALGIFASGWALKPVVGSNFLVMAHFMSALMLMTESAVWPLACVWTSIMFSSRSEIDAISSRTTSILVGAIAVCFVGYWAASLVVHLASFGVRLTVRQLYRMATSHRD